MAVVVAACGNPATTPTQATGTQVGEAQGQDGGDTAANADTIGQDTQAGDTLPVDVLSGGDATSTTDGTTGDTGGDAVKEATGGDVATDIDTTAGDTDASDADTTKPAWKCTNDSECAANFGDCIKGTCNGATGKCEVKPAPDKTACATGGVCGGKGECMAGACKATSACATGPCNPQPIKCGDKVTVDLGKLAASAFQAYLCAAVPWDGGEQAYQLAGDVSGTATVTLAHAATQTATVVSLAPPEAGKCDPSKCDAIGDKLVFGLQAGKSRVLVVEALKGIEGTVTLSVDCTQVQVCGDKVCTGSETCATCLKDCGACGNCGDGKCTPESGENCNDCAVDCGACAPECKAKKSGDADAKGCPGCPCEKCVCDMDKFCCATAWDEICVGECENKCQGPKCGAGGFCGDDTCDGPQETALNCPNDCVKGNCGDGICQAGETCKACSVDCGFCPPEPAPVCGNGKCDAGEHCATCPADCGACPISCMASKAPGCSGCACEACVCAEDAYCCNTAWDSICVGECTKDCGGPVCPSSACGDGSCAGAETCSSCAKDCGPCPPQCGDGTCTPGFETLEKCPQDCAVCGDGQCSNPGETCKSCDKDCGACQYASCNNNCGKQAQESGKDSCWCDDVCESAGDCCPDKTQFCPKK
jgi:hypothetical protein